MLHDGLALSAFCGCLSRPEFKEYYPRAKFGRIANIKQDVSSGGKVTTPRCALWLFHILCSLGWISQGFRLLIGMRSCGYYCSLTGMAPTLNASGYAFLHVVGHDSWYANDDNDSLLASFIMTVEAIRLSYDALGWRHMSLFLLIRPHESIMSCWAIHDVEALSDGFPSFPFVHAGIKQGRGYPARKPEDRSKGLASYAKRWRGMPGKPMRAIRRLVVLQVNYGCYGAYVTCLSGTNFNGLLPFAFLTVVSKFSSTLSRWRRGNHQSQGEFLAWDREGDHSAVDVVWPLGWRGTLLQREGGHHEKKRRSRGARLLLILVMMRVSKRDLKLASKF